MSNEELVQIESPETLKSYENFFQCDKCGKLLCKRCNKPQRYLKWVICSSCFSEFDEKSQERKKKIQEKKKARQWKFRVSCNISEIRGIIEYLSKIMEYITITLTHDGVEILSMDPSRISISIIRIKRSLFTEYSISCSKIRISLDVENLNKILEKIPVDNIIVIQRKNDLNHFQLCYDTKTIELLLEEISPEEIPHTTKLSKIDYKVKGSLYPGPLKESLELAEVVSESITFSYTKNSNLIIKSKGQIGKFLEKISVNNLLEYSLTEKIKSRFSINAIKYVITIFHDSIKTLILQLKTDNPLYLQATLKNGVEILQYTAPRVSET